MRRRSRLMAEINITPFTDVVLVLLIIFMITAPVLVQRSISVKLPAMKTAEHAPEQDRTITVVVGPRGILTVDGASVELNALRDRLSAKLWNNPDRPVMLKADRSVRYDAVVRVIDQARLAGARHFALGVELSKDGSGPAAGNEPADEQ